MAHFLSTTLVASRSIQGSSVHEESVHYVSM